MSPRTPALSRPGLPSVILVGLSLSIGWGIRGNFGHEYGAMIPGALAGLAGALLFGREDWQRRAAFFAFFGAIGWSFGGSISYMQVIGYTHSGHSASVLYGFANLFVIGFLWGAMGGFGTAMPVFLTRPALVEYFAPLTAVFLSWEIQDWVIGRWFAVDPAFRQDSALYWYDTDWMSASVAIAAVLLLAAVRRRWDGASSLLVHMGVGWWLAFLLLVNALGLRMTPPRGDNWAGCLGMVGGIWVWCARRGEPGLAWATLFSGLVGGFGFATADLFKLFGIETGWRTNWHSVLEQSYGLINGIGIGLMLWWLAPGAPRVSEEPRMRSWAEGYAAGFVLLVIPYVNLVKNVDVWVGAKAMPATLAGLSAEAWFNLAFTGLAGVFLLLFRAHRRRPLVLLPPSSLGRGQWLYLLLLWCMTIGNFERALVSFAPERLITEGVIFLNALVCSLGLLLLCGPAQIPGAPSAVNWAGILRRTALLGTACAALSILVDWGVMRVVFGDRPIGNASKHIRFGPNATVSPNPKAGKPHP